MNNQSISMKTTFRPSGEPSDCSARTFNLDHTPMIIWQGLGILVPVMAIGISLIQFRNRGHHGDDQYYLSHGWPKLVALWLAAAVIYGMACMLDSVPAKVLIEKDTGKEIVMRQRHSFFLSR